MKTEYRIQLTMLFNNSADRDTWYAAVKDAIVKAKSTKPTCKSIVGSKDDYFVQEPINENL